MSKILTPGVFITNNFEVARDMFASYSDVEQIPPSDDYLVITSKTNKYLQSLEYSINFDNENNPSLTLEFLDTDGNFEQVFSMHRSNTVFKMMQRRLSDQRARTVNINSSGVGLSEATLVDEFEYANQFNKIFVAFGTDSSLSNWSDVLTFYLNKTNIDISNGLRKYIFKFFASNDSVLRPKLVFNLNDPNPSREFVFTDSIDEFLVSIPIDSSTFSKDTLINVIYRIVKKYLSILTATPEKNIIGILPKIQRSDPGAIPGIENRLSNINLNDVDLSVFGISLESYYTNLLARSQRQVIPPGTTPRPGAMDAEIEANSGSKTGDAYIIRCKNNPSSEIHPAFPNFYQPLNKLNIALKSVLGTADNFVVVQENNLKLLSLWKQWGLIDSANDKCIIFGLEQMISEYLYRNYIPVGSAETNKTFEEYISNITNEFTPTLQIYGEGDELYSKDGDLKTNVAEILLDKEYGISFLKTVSRGKTSSNFFEQTNLDELSLNQDADSRFTNFFRNSDFLKLFDIPVFTNNLKNSNILNIQFTNSEVYLMGMKLAIDSNFAKAYVASINKNVDQVNIEGLNLRSIFDEYKKLLDEINPDQLQKLKEVLMYQLYLAKEQKRTPPRSNITKKDVSNQVAEELQGKFAELQNTIFNNQNLIEFLTSIKPEPVIVLDRIDIEGKGGFRVMESMDEVHKRLKTKFKRVIPKQEIKEVIKRFEKLVIFAQNLILKNGGDFNTNEVLLGTAILNLQSNYDSDNLAFYRLNEDKRIESVLSFVNTLFNIFDIKTLDSKDLPDGVVFKPKEFGLYQENIASELWKHLNNQVIKLSIKTLPFFHLSTLRLVNFKPCFLFSKQVTPINPNSNSISNNLDFFSGVYNIAAIKHVINTRECYSQFMLVKTNGNAYAL